MSITPIIPIFVEPKPELVVPGVKPRPKLVTPKPTSQRLPPPSLFQGPPSRNASHVSIVLPGSSNPGQSGFSKQQQQPTSQPQPRPSRVPEASSFSGSPQSARQRDQPQTPAMQSENDRSDALWAEMQNTLAEVEVSAMNSSYVFGASHAKALEDLRTSQLALAQAWAKSEADEMAENDYDAEGAGPIGAMTEGVLAVGAASPNSGVAGKKAKEGDKEKVKAGDKSKDKDKDKDDKTVSAAKAKSLEAETERDIQLARRRREANDRYFQQVNRGVLDVVSQLEEVANAMRRVEKESRDIWSDSSGEEGLAIATATESETDATPSALTSSPVSQRK